MKRILFISACLLAYLTYRCVETRFANARRRAALAILGVASLAVAGAAAYIYLHAGLPDSRPRRRFRGRLAAST